MTVGEAARVVALRIEPFAGEESLHEARILLSALVGVSVGALSIHRDLPLTREQLTLLTGMVERREKSEPVQYILGEWEFMGLPFAVDARVLIPRPDTEVLCEQALSLAKARGYTTALDLCTGSGCVGIALASLGGLTVTLSDVSPDCVCVAEENARENGVSVKTCVGDLFAPVSGTFDLIVCNPPYLSSLDMAALQPEVRFEPALALYGGEDGLEFYRRIAAEYPRFLRPGGALLLEIGSAEEAEVSKLFHHARCVSDYAGLPRVIIVEG